MKGIKFGDVHSYTGLNLITSKINIPPAAVKTNYVDIPGGDGSVDLTEALGEVRYKTRNASFTLTVKPGDDFEVKKKDVSNKLNGLKCKIWIDKDPGFYWIGRCEVNNYASNKNLHTIVVNAVLEPYKYKNDVTTVTIGGGDSSTTTLWNARKSVVPTITTTAETTLGFKGNTYTLNAGTHKILDLKLVEGANDVTINTAGMVTFTYQEGDL